MTAPTMVAELEQQHRQLEQEIQNELAHPNADSLRLAELKRKKLQLKDEMARVRSSQYDTIH